MSPAIEDQRRILEQWASSKYAKLEKRGLLKSLKHPDNPILTGGPEEWDERGSSFARVIKWEGTYYMIYSGDPLPLGWDQGQIGLATSEDGIEWTKYEGNPIIELGPDGAWDDTMVAKTSAPFYYEPDDEFWIYYTGNDGANSRIGRATSPDLKNWTKDPDNPVLDLGPSGAWDDRHVERPTLVWDGEADQWIMYYAGRDGVYWKIGGATSPKDDGVNWTKFDDNPVTIEPPNYYSPDVHHLEPSAFFWKEWIILLYSSMGRREGWRSLSVAVSKDGHNFSRGVNPLLEPNNLSMPKTGYYTIENYAINVPYVYFEREKLWMYVNLEHGPEHFHDTGLVYLRPDYFDRILDNVAQYFLDTGDQAPWKSETIAGGDSAMSPFNLLTYEDVTIIFETDTAGNLTIEGDFLGDGDFQTLESRSVGAGETVTYKVDADLSFVRLTFDTGATVTAKISARRNA